MKQYAITVPKSSAFTIKTPDDFIQLHSVTLAVAKREEKPAPCRICCA